MVKAVRIGVIAEEQNDVDVIYELTCKLIKENRFSFSRFLGHGCGKVRKKSRIWAQNLIDRGCSHIVVVHDLDKRDEKELRAMLEKKIRDINLGQRVVLIPIEEIEAWLLSDPRSLKTVFNMRRLPRIPKSPEKISGPKEFLANVVRQNSKTLYLNTVHNRRIARSLLISNLIRCPSFSRYPKFLETIFPRPASWVR